MYPLLSCVLPVVSVQCPAVVLNQEVRMEVCESSSCPLSEDQRRISSRDEDKYRMCLEVLQ